MLPSLCAGDLQRRLCSVLGLSGRTSPVLNATNRCLQPRRVGWKVSFGWPELCLEAGASGGDLSGLPRVLLHGPHICCE